MTLDQHLEALEREDLPLTPDEHLLRTAFQLTVKAVSRGNDISHDHYLALRAASKLLVEQTTGTIRGIWAMPAFTGFGKSCAISSFASALILERRAEDLPILVCQGTVEALKEMKDDIEANVPVGLREGMIGVYHTVENAPIKSIARSELGNYPILLVPHARLLTGKDMADFMEFEGLRRHLIHDESMVRHEGVGVRLGQLRHAAGGLLALLGARTELRAFLETIVDRIEAAVFSALTGERKPYVIVDVPDISKKALETGLTQVADKLRDGKDSPISEAVRKFLQTVPGRKLRVVPGTKDELATLVQYRTVIHPDITDATIFDASASIRELTRIDPTIKDSTTEVVSDGRPAFTYRGNLKDLKSWERVRFFWDQRGGGKTEIARDYAAAKKAGEICDRSVRIAEIIKRHPGERILIVTHKDDDEKEIRRRARRRASTYNRADCLFQTVLKEDLVKLGVDLNEPLWTSEDHRSRFVFMTWGRVTGRNDARDCTVAILAGVTLRDVDQDLIPAALGQLDDIEADATKYREILQQSEAAHEIYQAVSRVACREMEGRLAKPCTVYVTHYRWDAIQLAASEMPGVKLIKEAKTKAAAKTDKRFSEKRAQQVEAFTATFKAIKEGTVKSAVVKERTLRKHPGLFEGTKDNRVAEIMTEAASAACWRKEGAGSQLWVFDGDPF